MAVIDRRNREKREMKNAILQVARDIAARDGWQNLTIRKICDEIHYTAPVIYQYFESKDMILLALRMEAIGLAYQDFEKLHKKTNDPAKLMMEYGLIWWNFADTNPELYQVIYNLQGVMCPEEGKPHYLENIRQHYRESLMAINSKARRSEKYMWELYDNFGCLIHGFISIYMVNKIRSGQDNAKTVFKNALQRYIQSINDTICPKEN